MVHISRTKQTENGNMLEFTIAIVQNGKWVVNLLKAEDWKKPLIILGDERIITFMFEYHKTLNTNQGKNYEMKRQRKQKPRQRLIVVLCDTKIS